MADIPQQNGYRESRFYWIKSNAKSTKKHRGDWKSRRENPLTNFFQVVVFFFCNFLLWNDTFGSAMDINILWYFRISMNTTSCHVNTPFTWHHINVGPARYVLYMRKLKCVPACACVSVCAVHVNINNIIWCIYLWNDMIGECKRCIAAHSTNPYCDGVHFTLCI